MSQPELLRELQLPQAHLSAASALVRVAERLFVVADDELRIEVEHLPAAGTVQRYAIVHFSRVDHNDLPGRGVNLAKMAPRALGAARKNTEAKLLVGMA